jgi:hypothetical protein
MRSVAPSSPDWMRVSRLSDMEPTVVTAKMPTATASTVSPVRILRRSR